MTSELNRCRGLLKVDPDANRGKVVEQLKLWLEDRDLAPVRFGFPIPGVPREEMQAWAKFWRDVRTLRDEWDQMP